MHSKNNNQKLSIDDSKAKKIWEIIESSPNQVFNLRKICQLYNSKYDNKIEPLRASTIISRLYNRSKIIRTKTQLKDGHLYSLSNKIELDALYKNYLLPYDFEDKENILKLLTKNRFGKLRTDNKELSDDISSFVALNVGFLMCDGHIKNNLLQIRYYFNQKSDAKLFKTNFLLFFPKERVSIKPTSSCYTLTVCNKKLATYFHSLGVPRGNKVCQPFTIPSWIYHGSDPIKRTFLSVIYGNEGSKPIKNKWRIQFVLSKNKKFVPDLLLFLNQIRTMLNHFDINTSHIQLRKQKNREFCGRFYITGKENLVTFYNKLEFSYASEKQKVLESLILKGKS
ncbi:hypothetical protein ISS07_01815 [Candidatus Woesearchaeota archaeon]|nr:hypothetical protein [Candidatus Woesearchaeota archaeon]